MKSLLAAFLASAAFIVSLEGFCQGGAKKDAAADANKTQVPTQTGIAVSSVTISQSGPSKPFGSHLDPILKTVSASEEQRKSITAVVDEFKVRIVPLRKRHDELRDEFFKALTSGQSGETVLTAQSEFIRAQTDLNAQYLALRLKIQQILTAEQNEKFAAYQKKQGWRK